MCKDHNIKNWLQHTLSKQFGRVGSFCKSSSFGKDISLDSSNDFKQHLSLFSILESQIPVQQQFLIEPKPF